MVKEEFEHTREALEPASAETVEEVRYAMVKLAKLRGKEFAEAITAKYPIGVNQRLIVTDLSGIEHYAKTGQDMAVARTSIEETGGKNTKFTQYKVRRSGIIERTVEFRDVDDEEAKRSLQIIAALSRGPKGQEYLHAKMLKAAEELEEKTAARAEARELGTSILSEQEAKEFMLFLESVLREFSDQEESTQ